MLWNNPRTWIFVPQSAVKILVCPGYASLLHMVCV